MSGPLSANEIEDVVSSVRRLVSADEPRRPTTRDLAQDRLVLGPAFRITPDDPAAGSPLLLTTPLKDVDGASQTFEADWEEELWTEPDPPLSELALGAEEAELVAEIAVERTEPGATPASDLEPDDSPWADVGEEWLANDPGQGKSDATAAPNAGSADAGLASRPDVLKLSAEDMLTDGDGNPLTVLDEAALQQIIRQLIREELKGVLGERITHSVRKLVRAEINRALAAHALD